LSFLFYYTNFKRKRFFEKKNNLKRKMKSLFLSLVVLYLVVALCEMTTGKEEFNGYGNLKTKETVVSIIIIILSCMNMTQNLLIKMYYITGTFFV